MASSSRTYTETPLQYEDQVREYRQRQRQRHNLQRGMRTLSRRLSGRQQREETLETQIDPERELNLSLQRRASIVPAEVLYHSRRDDVNHRVYTYWSEEAVLCTDGQQIDRTLIHDESFRHLERARLRYIHIGVIQVRLQILHRREEGTLALIVFRDNRWQGEQAIMAQMEVSLSQGGYQMVYVIPDIMMTIGDFYRNVQISVQTRGYTNWHNGEANLLVTRGLVGRLSNTSNVGFQYSINSVTDYLISNGVRAIPGKKFSEEELRGRNWVIRPSQSTVPMEPTEAVTRNLPDGAVSMRFENYQAAAPVRQPQYDQNDNEILDSEEEESLRNEEVHFLEEDPVHYPLSYIPRGMEKCNWDSLGPDGRFMVRYDIPEEVSLPIHADGWGTDFEEFWEADESEQAVQHRTQEENYEAGWEEFESMWEEPEPAEEINVIIEEPEEVGVILSKGAKMPEQKTSGAAGYDLCSTEDLYILPAERDTVKTGVQLQIPAGLYGRIADKSSLAIKGLTVCAGVIDSDFRGEIKVVIHNHSGAVHFIQKGKPIAQLIFNRINNPKLTVMGALSQTTRGDKGFGSTSESIKMTEDILATEEEVITKLKQLMSSEDILMETGESSTTGRYQPPKDTMMGPPVYPPAMSTPTPPLFYEKNIRASKFREANYMNWWNLPSAQQNIGAMLIIPNDLSKFDEVFMRWESITKNLVAMQGFTDNDDKAEFIENLLGESEKLTWVQWRSNFEDEYKELVSQSDGRRGTQNITSQIRRVLTLEDPYQGSTAAQDQAYKDLERLQCRDVKDIIPYLQQYLHLAAKSGRMFVGTELSDKLFIKMPRELGKRIEEQFKKRYTGNTIGVNPRVLFSYKYLEEQCKEAAFQRSLKNLDFYKQIPIPGYYDSSRKKYGARKATTYKGKPHKTHVKIDKSKNLRNKKCKCYLCGEEGHFARECTNKRRNVERVAVFDTIELPEGHELVSVDEDDSADEVYSVSEGEEPSTLFMHLMPMAKNDEYSLVLSESDTTDCDYLVGRRGGWQPLLKLTKNEFHCQHDWQVNTKVTGCPEKCRNCGRMTSDRHRIQCPKCLITCCGLCSTSYFNKKIEVAVIQVQPYFATPQLLQQQQQYISWCQHEMEKLSQALLEKDKALEELNEVKNMNEFLKQQLKEEKEKNLQLEMTFKGKEKVTVEDVTNEETTLVSTEKEVVEEVITVSEKLIVLGVKLMIPGLDAINVRAILDTGASCCNINTNCIPKEAIEQSPYSVNINGINSSIRVDKKLKYGKMMIGTQEFNIPFTYAFPMNKGLKTDMQMVLGCNFIRALYGGVRIEGNEVTFYKYITKLQAMAVTDEQIDFAKEFLYYMENSEESFAVKVEESANIKRRISKQLSELTSTGYIGNEPLVHWKKNQVKCKLEIINPNLRIDDKPLRHVTPQMAVSFKKQVDELLKLKVIRPSTSSHRTTAFLVNSGTSIDPKTGAEIKGKERMVFNYQRLNDNTEKDQYPLPGINTIIQRIARSKVYSKFDLKSGFHQVAMDENSIPYTAFTIPGLGLYEWLVMPFGLKNAPSIFQRKMDNCFKGTEAFIAVYIDDILVFSPNEEAHVKHLNVLFDIIRKNGLVLSPTKMKMGIKTVDFLGVQIQDGRVQLQEHILKKIAKFGPAQYKEKKDLRSWLGLLNYARNFIPNIGKTLGPLYAKTSPTGEKRMNKEDWKIVSEVQQLIENLPTLEVPPVNVVIILECDGCMTGWGAICKWKQSENDPRRTENVSAYASGTYNPILSTIDAEIGAVLHALEVFKIYYLSQAKVIIRTDCQAIISFFNKSFNHKPSRLRWIRFVDFISGTGIPYKFEHILGKENQLADHLSRNPQLANTLSKLVCLFLQEWQEIPAATVATLSEAMLTPTTAILTLADSVINSIERLMHSKQQQDSPCHGLKVKNGDDSFMSFSSRSTSSYSLVSIPSRNLQRSIEISCLTMPPVTTTGAIGSRTSKEMQNSSRTLWND
ncbi:polyprotein [Fatsia badnavirus 1]|uniref:RNA-directed DNA polymerase n=1 Tax=Fatsia badnavirus 1 TaxID=2999080 RepID=A0A9E8Z0K1_9VIRU|nr:polyprotein [Fatsia badnavirus 1]